jgi:hypothetical protein
MATTGVVKAKKNLDEWNIKYYEYWSDIFGSRDALRVFEITPRGHSIPIYRDRQI